MELTQFGVFPKFELNLEVLANKLALKEMWEYSNAQKEYEEGNMAAAHKLPILRNYLIHTWKKVWSEDKIAYTEDKQYACFNTGLVTPNLEEIFGLFSLNRFPNSRFPYFFKAFIKKSDFEFLTYFSHNSPLPADYFSEPANLLFDPRIQIIPDLDHIIQDNQIRFPGHLRTGDIRTVRKHLMGAIDDIGKRVKINYKIAIPQFYDNRFQLLLPLYLVDTQKPDLALVVEKINPTTYSARTCLTLGMAYNNARLIVCPQSEWLQP